MKVKWLILVLLFGLIILLLLLYIVLSLIDANMHRDDADDDSDDDRMMISPRDERPNRDISSSNSDVAGMVWGRENRLRAVIAVIVMTKKLTKKRFRQTFY